MDVSCQCGTNFCFECVKDAHLPIDCETLAQWQDRLNQGDNDSESWIKINTKPCPECKMSIQKNSGCMHMTCSQCRFEFCWLCMGNYRNHQKETGAYICNSFADVEKFGRADKKGVLDADALARELKRLEHYSMRFIEHQKSIKFAQNALDLFHKQIAEAMRSNPKYTPTDFQFILDISALVIAARRSLSYTYPIRFYLKGSNKQAFYDFI